MIQLYSACLFSARVRSLTLFQSLSAYSPHIIETFLVTHALSTNTEFSFLIHSVAHLIASHILKALCLQKEALSLNLSII
jgi:hypothetical protein